MNGVGKQRTAYIRSQKTQTASFQITADEWAAGKFWIHMEWRHTQGPDTTSLYSTNTEHGEVGGQRIRGHGLVVGRGEKSIFMVLAQALSGRCLAGMAYYPKEAS